MSNRRHALSAKSQYDVLWPLFIVLTYLTTFTRGVILTTELDNRLYIAYWMNQGDQYAIRSNNK
jgi:hypothetical protein